MTPAKKGNRVTPVTDGANDLHPHDAIREQITRRQGSTHDHTLRFLEEEGTP